MTKEYTGKEFEIEFARAWLKYVEGGKVGVDPRNDWEFSDMFKDWSGKSGFPLCNSKSYRWKPKPKRMVTIGYASGDGYWQSRELVAPEVDEPANRTAVFITRAEGVMDSIWSDDSSPLKNMLKSGHVFLTREDAKAMSDWLAVCRRGGV